MEIRNHTADDYPIFCHWWGQWGWPSIPYEFLPKNSLVVCHDDRPICAVFLYATDSPIVWAEYYISSKSDPLRDEAMNVMLKGILPASQAMGAKAVMSGVRHPHLAKRLRAVGFVKSDENLTSYILAV